VPQLPLDQLDVLDPGRTGLVAFDLLEMYRAPIEEAGSLPHVQRLIEACRARDVPILYARADHRPDGADAAVCATDVDIAFRPWGPDNPPITKHPHGSGEPQMQVLREVAPRPGDYDVPKHRWNAFHQTHLDLSLRTRGIDTVLLVGGSTHVGIASTAFAARDMDYHVIVVSDGCHGYPEQREFFMRKVFPRMCRVRTVDQVVAMFDAHADSAQVP
jgi:nicotinamidase-related amidase